MKRETGVEVRVELTEVEGQNDTLSPAFELEAFCSPARHPRICFTVDYAQQEREALLLGLGRFSISCFNIQDIRRLLCTP